MKIQSLIYYLMNILMFIVLGVIYFMTNNQFTLLTIGFILGLSVASFIDDMGQ